LPCERWFFSILTSDNKGLFLKEEHLITQLKAGDDNAFKYFVEKYQNLVYNTSLGMLQHAEDAEDITQEVFIQVYHTISQFKGEAKLSTWLYRVAVTRSLDHLRAKKRKKRFAFIQSLFGTESNEPLVEQASFVHPGVQLENKERAGILFAAIAKLPENQKIAFTLNKVEGLSYEEVAEVMQTSVSSVESLLFRARNNLKTHLQDYYKAHH
jgi:RNA polymerase sigma-70 factor (ECF subfamily)